MPRRDVTLTSLFSLCSPAGVCAPYNMTVCAPYLGTRRVFFNLTYPRGAEHNEGVVRGLWDEMIASLMTSCRCVGGGWAGRGGVGGGGVGRDSRVGRAWCGGCGTR